MSDISHLLAFLFQAIPRESGNIFRDSATLNPLFGREGRWFLRSNASHGRRCAREVALHKKSFSVSVWSAMGRTEMMTAVVKKKSQPCILILTTQQTTTMGSLSSLRTASCNNLFHHPALGWRCSECDGAPANTMTTNSILTPGRNSRQVLAPKSGRQSRVPRGQSEPRTRQTTVCSGPPLAMSWLLRVKHMHNKNHCELRYGHRDRLHSLARGEGFFPCRCHCSTKINSHSCSNSVTWCILCRMCTLYLASKDQDWSSST